MRAGFVGLGSQGGPMAMRIAQDGLPLTVWARRPQAAEDCVAAGAAAACDMAALGAASDVLGICVFADSDVLEVAKPALANMAEGSVMLIHSTVHPDTARTVAAWGRERGVAVLDAPVSGGPVAAREGRLTVMVGGDRAVLERCAPVLECYAGSGLISWLGDVGAGCVAKLINNTLMAANLGLADEAVRVAERLGIDRTGLNNILKVSSGGSLAHTVYATREKLADFERTSQLLGKDLGLLAQVAEASGVEMKRLDAVARAFFADVAAAVAAQTVSSD